MPTSALEKRIVADVIDLVRSRGGFCFKYSAAPYGVAGVPDVPCCYRGVSVWFEVKRPGKRPTTVQFARHAEIRAAGGVVAVVTSSDEAEAVLDDVDRAADEIGLAPGEKVQTVYEIVRTLL